jgi:tetratricopeptide (TPR) repeat protein
LIYIANRVFLMLLPGFIAGNALLAQVSQKKKQEKAKTYALVVGISQYQHKSIPSLRFAENDAKLFAEYLQSPAGGGIPASRVKVFTGAQATISNIYNGLIWLKANCRKGDKVLFYFSGHGDVETEKLQHPGYLLAWNTPPNNYRGNAIGIDDVNDWANEVSVKKKAQVVMIMDACHSGKLAGDFLKGKQLAKENLLTVLNNEARIAACGPDELAAEGLEWGAGRGVFSYYLLHGLNGMAKPQPSGIITLASLTQFMDSSFAQDIILKQQNHKQKPILDGHPALAMTHADPQVLISYQRNFIKAIPSPKLPQGLLVFRELRMQPLDYFFQVLKDQPIESVIDFTSYLGKKPSQVPQLVIGDCIGYLEQLELAKQQPRSEEEWEQEFEFASLDSLRMLQDGLNKNKQAISRFNELFVTSVHTRAQEMINAYLSGDVEELERRQYYFSGSRSYDDFFPMMDLAMQVAPDNHYLLPLLKVQFHYLSGLQARLQMPFVSNTDSLMAIAIKQQSIALALEPYAAFIHNEMGNLLLRKSLYDSADTHFEMAMQLAPTWAIPWSNQTRLYLALNDFEKAKRAAQIADSLQPDLAFVQMNLGLVSEREGDLLTAQMYYRRSIQNNPVHFLPYERLGHILLKTGDYDEADKMLHDAALRKDDFAVNSEYYSFGIELGGPMSFNDFERLFGGCDLGNLDKVLKLPFISLLAGLMEFEAPITKNREQAFQELITLSKQHPDLPFLHHYIGQYYFKSGNYTEAEVFLKHAIELYREGTDMRDWLLKNVFVSTIPEEGDTCILSAFMFFHYNRVEDGYWLAKIYEETGRMDLALGQYKKITQIEKENLFEQAALTGFFEQAEDILINPNGPDREALHQLAALYEQNIHMGAYIKVVHLYEQMGRYEEAERALLEQVAVSRKAGDIRGEVLMEKGPGYHLGINPLNYYWLEINRDVEVVAYEFYQRMITLFPRNPEWFKKASLFLHDRLVLAYSQMPPDEYKAFTESISNFSYPWEGGEGGPMAEILHFKIPVTGEEINISKPVYHPVEVSFIWMQAYLTLSRESNPEERVVRALANLHSWRGEVDQAIFWFEKYLASHPLDSKIRYEAACYMNAMDYLKPAYLQLDTLYQRGQLDNVDIPLLSSFHMLTGRFKAAEEVLEVYQPGDPRQKANKAFLKSRIYWLNGKMNEALTCLKDEMELPEVTGDDSILLDNPNKLHYSRFYSMARIYAMNGEEKPAFEYLSHSIKHGFNHKHVLMNDEVWKRYRDSDIWQDRFGQIAEGRDYAKGGYEFFRNPIVYRIPNYFSEYFKKVPSTPCLSQ